MPEFKSTKNQFLKVAAGVILTERIDNVIHALDKFFQARNMVRYVTSGYRLKSEQLGLIIRYLEKNGIKPEYTRYDVDKKNEIGQYLWQYDWSRLLALGYLISPPCKAEVLCDSYNKQGWNRKGQTWNPSGHFNGDCFDIAGNGGDQDPDDAASVDDELSVVNEARQAEPGLGIKDVVVERKNNCLHTITGGEA